MYNPSLITVGTINGGATPIQADVTSLGLAVSVILSADYTMLQPPGYPFRPSFTGSETPQYPHTLASGTTVTVLGCEAAALVAAGAASYA